MAKDPAVLFYYQDFLVGTAFFTNEQVGAYQRILCWQYDKGSVSLEDIMQICKTEKLWLSIKHKFKMDPDGTWFNERAREEKIKRQKHKEKQTSNANIRWSGNAKDMPKPEVALPLEDEDEDVNENVNRNSPEGMMFRSWGKHPKNLSIGENNLLQKIWLLTGEDPELMRYAFNESIRMNKKSFAYIRTIVENKLKERDLQKVKKKEIEAKQKKIQEARELKPDQETAKIFKEISDSMKVKKSVEPKVNDYKSSAAYLKAKKEFERAIQR